MLSATPLLTGLFVRLTAVVWLLAAGLWGAAGATVTNASVPQTQQPVGWTVTALPGASVDIVLNVLRRSALTVPSRYFVVVVPGSGCTGWLPFANRYFAGLLHADLLVLHKPGVEVDGGPAAICNAEFIQSDVLSTWRDHSKAALRTFFARQRAINPSEPSLPVLLIGISEGAELLPDLAPEVPHLAGVVMISAPGLDPVETGELQARRMGQVSAWLELERVQSSNMSNDTIHQGRAIGYWRDFWRWKLTQPLLDASWPLLRVWGGADAMVPEIAYQLFTQRSRTRSVPGCQIQLPGADHGLQSDKLDGLQWLWARIEVWARNSENGFCKRVLP